MVEKFRKYFLVITLCTIMCKVLFPYSSASLNKQELNTSSSISTLGVDDSDNDLEIFRVENEKRLNYLLYFSVWENEETDEDETSDEIFQKESFHLTFIKTNIFNFIGSRNCFAKIPLFVLFHSWKCFLF